MKVACRRNCVSLFTMSEFTYPGVSVLRGMFSPLPLDTLFQGGGGRGRGRVGVGKGKGKG